MTQITITLTDVQAKALSCVTTDVQDWIENLTVARCDAAIAEIFEVEVKRMVADPNITDIPADRNTVIMNSTITSLSDYYREVYESEHKAPTPPI
jgi:hypothetical protein